MSAINGLAGVVAAPDTLKLRSTVENFSIANSVKALFSGICDWLSGSGTCNGLTQSRTAAYSLTELAIGVDFPSGVAFC